MIRSSTQIKENAVDSSEAQMRAWDLVPVTYRNKSKHDWYITTMDVTKDTTTRWYECRNTGMKKKVVEKYKYTQYNSRLDKTITTYYDSDGQLMEGYKE